MKKYIYGFIILLILLILLNPLIVNAQRTQFNGEQIKDNSINQSKLKEGIPGTKISVSGTAEVYFGVNNVQSLSDTLAVLLNSLGGSSGSSVKAIGSSTFNSVSGRVISIGVTLTDTNYRVIILPSQDPSGYLGEVWIESKTTSQFTIKNSGSDTTSSFEWAVLQAGSEGGTGESATAIEDTGTYIENNTTWDFSTSYDTTAVIIYRNGIMQPRRLFDTSTVSDKTRIIFKNSINMSDEVILYSTK